MRKANRRVKRKYVVQNHLHKPFYHIHTKSYAMLCTLFSLQPKAEIKACSGNMQYIQGENLITLA